MEKLPKGIRWRSGKLFIDVTVGGKRRTKTMGTDVAKAKAQREHMVAVLEGRKPDQATIQLTKVWTLAQAMEEAQLTAEPDGWRGQKNLVKTVQNADAAVRWFGGGRRLDTISYTDLEGYCRHLENDLHNAGATVNRKLAALSKMMRLAVDRDALSRRPKFPRRKEGKGRLQYLNYEEEAELLEHLLRTGRQDMAELVAVLIDTGLRVGDCLALTYKDINLASNKIEFWIDKNGYDHGIPLTTRARGVLVRRLPAALHGAIFPMKYGSARHMWDKAKNRLGYGDESWYVIHILRHTCASRLVQGGRPLTEVQKWMGHTCFTTTQRYAHLAPDQLNEAVHVLEGGPSVAPVADLLPMG